MPQFIIQENRPNCGAFAVAYYHWLTSGIPEAEGTQEEQEQAQKEEVEEITEEVLFGTDNPVRGLENYCDPVKMITYMTSVLGVDEAKIKFYSGGAGNPADVLLEAMLSTASEENPNCEGKLVARWLEDGLIQRAAVPAAWTGYLLSLGYALSRSKLSDEQPLPLAELANFAAVHYALVKRTSESIEIMNSWDGHFLPGAGYMANTALLKTGPYAGNEKSPNYNRLQFLSAGILITN